MKSFFLLLVFAVAGIGSFAQKIDKAKDLFSKQKLQEAKTEIENFLAVEKNKSNSEAWYLRSKIYGAIAQDSSLKGSTPTGREISFESLKKYVELENQVKDSAKRYLLLTIDNRKPLTDLYAGYSKDAASYYNAGNFVDALAGFQGSLNVFDFMTKQGWTNNITLDTISVLYAGISAEKASKPDTAAIYYGKIAEARIKGQGYESIYKWLADHYKEKNNIPMSNKFTTLGKEVYPEDPFWLGFEVNLLSEKGTKEELFAKYDEVIKANPTNHLFWFNYAVELYKTAYDEDSSKRPANSVALIDKAIEKVSKSIEVNPEYPNSHMLLGQIYYNQAVDIIAKNKKIRPTAGAKLKPEQLKAKETLRGESNKKFDEAVAQFEKLDQLLGSKGKLKMEEKQFLKDSYDLLINVYEQKGAPEKATVYTEKFNNVDKVH